MTMGLKDKKVVRKNRSFVESFKHAFDGLVILCKTERNFRFHLIASLVVVIMSFVLKIDLSQWVWILLAIFMVLIAEVVNTLCESIVNLIVGNKYDEIAKKAKDVAAAGVVIASIFAAIIGLLVYVPIIFGL
ncbi:diacylglycerol kinase family protein [Lactobacillus kunkeei]|uniref:Diacylglycerol kinase family protein n=1 Tax=Apilactobacillus nanyangensis TaxID=2799579 RepID=A0ABT0HWD4_9LACO|nr:diacylglycerol kinase family protein [Apilactobacillus nanyangensis]MBC6388032.1 diacylglycerol kinase family protein [Apilactobacillus kunkeei]MCK8611240.1 diacylglycerol kinase family protein [Apilactobacillus nanyangensis]TMT00310.1 diacylglycerol kinase family protein [Apilactobacillus kunkeei]TMT03445.1 diacylglycerol kinase family protein [Apilactobacillus kunkeei]